MNGDMNHEFEAFPGLIAAVVVATVILAVREGSAWPLVVLGITVYAMAAFSAGMKHANRQRHQPSYEQPRRRRRRRR